MSNTLKLPSLQLGKFLFCMKLVSKEVSCFKCFSTQETEPRKEIKKIRSHDLKIGRYLQSEPHLAEVKQYIPAKYFKLKRSSGHENLYLINSNIAKDIVKHVLPLIEENKNQVISEANAGLGLIASDLLDNGVPLVRLYEACPEFRETLKDFDRVYPARVEIFSKSIYNVASLNFMDKIDSGKRVLQLLSGVPTKDWSDEPVMTVIGPMYNASFIKFLIKSLALQNDLLKLGRIQLFAIMPPRDYVILSANNSNNLHTYQWSSVLFNLFFDSKLIEKYPRKAFVPWESKRRQKIRYPNQIDPDDMYLVQINFKRKLPLPKEDIIVFFNFVRQLFRRGTNRVIPTIEKWISGCGLNMILPKLKNNENFPQEIGIFTQFGELSPEEILAVYKEVVNHDEFKTSPLLAMIDSDLLKSETIESDLVTDLEHSTKDAQEKSEPVKCKK